MYRKEICDEHSTVHKQRHKGGLYNEYKSRLYLQCDSDALHPVTLQHNIKTQDVTI